MGLTGTTTCSAWIAATGEYAASSGTAMKFTSIAAGGTTFDACAANTAC